MYMYMHISQDGKALTAKVRGPRFNPGWLPVFHSSLKIFPSLSSYIFLKSIGNYIMQIGSEVIVTWSLQSNGCVQHVRH